MHPPPELAALSNHPRARWQELPLHRHRRRKLPRPPELTIPIRELGSLGAWERSWQIDGSSHADPRSSQFRRQGSSELGPRLGFLRFLKVGAACIVLPALCKSFDEAHFPSRALCHWGLHPACGRCFGLRRQKRRFMRRVSYSPRQWLSRGEDWDGNQAEILGCDRAILSSASVWSRES